MFTCWIKFSHKSKTAYCLRRKAVRSRCEVRVKLEASWSAGLASWQRWPDRILGFGPFDIWTSGLEPIWIIFIKKISYLEIHTYDENFNFRGRDTRKIPYSYLYINIYIKKYIHIFPSIYLSNDNYRWDEKGKI